MYFQGSCTRVFNCGPKDENNLRLQLFTPRTSAGESNPSYFNPLLTENLETRRDILAKKEAELHLSNRTQGIELQGMKSPLYQIWVGNNLEFQQHLGRMAMLILGQYFVFASTGWAAITTHLEIRQSQTKYSLGIPSGDIEHREVPRESNPRSQCVVWHWPLYQIWMKTTGFSFISKVDGHTSANSWSDLGRLNMEPGEIEETIGKEIVQSEWWLNVRIISTT
ncbi:hypothetical protein IW262DRAFT_1299648 [Armillaria fumosa]|nr:hypothetical protein IW262DRAFT_1299648 [Armillaria fumosa]